MAVSNVVLTPVSELAPGQVSSIRNSVIEAVVDIASRELSMPASSLVARDIRPYNDMGFGNNTDFMATATSVDVWGTFKSTDTYIVDGTGGAYRDACADSDTMDDNKFVAIFGVRDGRVSVAGTAPHVAIQDVSLIRFNIGNSYRALWDMSKIQCHKNATAGITPSAIVIPQRSPYQISCYLINGGDEQYLQLMGIVVEPVGITVSP